MNRIYTKLRHSLKCALYACLPDLVQELIDLLHYEKRLRNQTLVDEPEIDVLKHLVAPGDTVVDIGSNLGAYTLILSALVGHEGVVHSCEPVPRTFRLLSYCCNRLRPHDNIVFHQIAISERSGQAQFSVPVEGIFKHPNFYIGGLTISPARSSSQFTVKTKCLDDLNLASAEFLKVDVEGSEVAVINGGLRLLRQAKPSIVCETSAESRAEISTLLAPLGYEAWVCDRDSKRSPSIRIHRADDARAPRRASPNTLFLTRDKTRELRRNSDLIWID